MKGQKEEDTVEEGGAHFVRLSICDPHLEEVTNVNFRQKMGVG